MPRPLFHLSASQVSILLFALAALPHPADAQKALPDNKNSTTMSVTRARIHESDQWKEIASHLPDPKTASAKDLMQQADILRARRFPEDALDFYRYALDRGGDVVVLTNRLGLTEMEMKNFQLAHAYFQQAVKLNKKSPEAWNNLGASEFVAGATLSAISDYKKAIKLDKHSAVYHSNLASAYFDTKNFKGARKELAAALKIDPTIFSRKEAGGGLEAHVLSSQDRARFSFEMAKLYAQNGVEDQMLHSLAMAAEAGMDLAHELRRDPVLGKYLADPRVALIIHNAEVLRTGNPGPLNTASDAVQPPKPL
jgi:tetratricopeptide (TPR) repeat protein